MKGNCATEENILEVLNVMVIYAGRNFFAYGDVKEVITQDLVQEGSLKYQQVPNSDCQCYHFLWGP
jgi:hypothetical protein